MCLIAFAINAHERCPLLVASNRDEFWNRPTRPLTEWELPNGTLVYSGQDGLAGGTWLGFSRTGRVAMLTNVRTGELANAPRSRGELVTHWLAGETSSPDWGNFFERFSPEDFGGFNLIVGEAGTDSWAWLSNRDTVEPTHTPNTQAKSTPPGWFGQRLNQGVYGLSNAGLNTPWPKTLALKSATHEALNVFRTADSTKRWQQPLLNSLLDMRQSDASQLPSTGVTLEREQALSSAFVHMLEAGYGTRSSMLAHWNGKQLVLDEWTHQTTCEAMRPQGHKWPLEQSLHKRISIAMWGIPTSS